MKKAHEQRTRLRRSAEPVQVYLERPDRARLERLATQLDVTKSDVLRRGLEALEHQLSDPGEHPALRVIGLAERELGRRSGDVARDHDRYLADGEIASWGAGAAGGKRRHRSARRAR